MALPDEFHELARKVNNWGRWGADDELGTLNLITAEVVRGAAALVRRGKVFTLALPLGPDGPQIGAMTGRLNPLRTMLMVNRPVFDPEGFCTSDDIVVMGLQAATHWDALAHAGYGRLLRDQGRIESAREHLGRALHILERLGTLREPERKGLQDIIVGSASSTEWPPLAAATAAAIPPGVAP